MLGMIVEGNIDLIFVVDPMQIPNTYTISPNSTAEFLLFRRVKGNFRIFYVF